MGSYYDNFTEENMEETDQNIEILMCGDPFEDRDSLLCYGHDNTSETNFLHRTRNLFNESPIVIEDDDDDDSSHHIRNLFNESPIVIEDDDVDDSSHHTRNLFNESPIVIEDDDDDDSSHHIRNLFNESPIVIEDDNVDDSSHHTRNLFNESPIVIEDDDVDDSLNDINNSGIIDVRNELNMPIPEDQITVSDDSEDDSDLEIIEPLILLNKYPNILKRKKENNSLNLKKFKIASTATLNLDHNYMIVNGTPAGCSSLTSNASSHRLKATVQKKQLSSSPRSVQLSSNSESLKQSNSLRLSHTNSETRRSQNLKILKAVEKPSNKYKVSLSVKINYFDAPSDSSDKDDTSFITCKYEKCDYLVEPELMMDDLYCSLECKNQKQTVTEEEHFIDETSNPTEKTTVDRNHILTKLKNRIDKRKQLLKTSCPEEYDISNERVMHFFNEPSKNENQPLLKSLLSISYLEAIDDDDDYDDNNYFYLKPLIEDKDVSKYMTGFQLRSAPLEFFDRPFSIHKNLFVVGEKLEGIDPKSEALFCVMTVSEVCGYRIKLHFDGYGSENDFWVNADCPDLFHAGFCKMNSRPLQPPYNYGNIFDWTDYLRECQAEPAPKCNFVSTKNLNSCKIPHKFHIGGKLEALDKLTRTLQQQLIYVATVADILGNRIRVHFDGWTDDFDYWADITSTYIHPIRWCEKNGRTLLPPRYYKAKKGRKPFNWDEYLAETKSEPVHEDAFVRRPLRDFSNEMIIEVFDLVVPRLLRISKIVDVRGDELKIVYDGFDNDYAYWIEDDSPDVHPVGWSSKVNHPIQLPPESNTLWSCNIHGCKGYGNSSNDSKIDHVEIKDCPYEMDAWKNAVTGFSNVPDRLETHKTHKTTTLLR